MIAVVDRQAQRLVEIGATAAARGLRRLVHDHSKPRLGKAHRRAQARDAGPDDMDGASGS